MKTDLFQSCGHCWVFYICWHIECSTFTASSFRIWKSSTGIPSPPLALFIVMLPKAHLTSQSQSCFADCIELPHPLTENWIKDLLSMALPIRTRPSFPSVSLSHQEASISLLSFSSRGQANWKPHSQKTNIWWQPCLTQWNYEPCHLGLPKMDGSWWKVLTKRGPLEKGMANHVSILALRTPWTVWKGKKDRTLDPVEY